MKVTHSCLTLRPHRLYSPWNSPGQNTGEGSLFLLQGIFPTQGLNPGLPHCRWSLYQLSHQGSPRILGWVVYPTPSPADCPDLGIKLGSSALQADSLLTELSGKSSVTIIILQIYSGVSCDVCSGQHRYRTLSSLRNFYCIMLSRRDGRCIVSSPSVMGKVWETVPSLPAWEGSMLTHPQVSRLPGKPTCEEVGSPHSCPSDQGVLPSTRRLFLSRVKFCS